MLIWLTFFFFFIESLQSFFFYFFNVFLNYLPFIIFFTIIFFQLFFFGFAFISQHSHLWKDLGRNFRFIAAENFFYKFLFFRVLHDCFHRFLMLYFQTHHFFCKIFLVFDAKFLGSKLQNLASWVIEIFKTSIL